MLKLHACSAPYGMAGVEFEGARSINRLNASGGATAKAPSLIFGVGALALAPHARGRAKSPSYKSDGGKHRIERRHSRL
jgi:hypothetical protein